MGSTEVPAGSAGDGGSAGDAGTADADSPAWLWDSGIEGPRWPVACS
jgi:hypothetical protein